MIDKNILFFKVFDDLDRNNLSSNEKISHFEIEEYENKYNFKFPNDYKEFLLEYNGCNLKDTIKENGKTMHVVNKYCGFDSISDFPSIKIQIEIFEEDWFFFQELIENKFIPIAGSIYDFINILIYCGEENKGKIYRCNEDGNPRYLCDSFSDFISGYYFTEFED